MDWAEAVREVNRHVVKISTPSGHGTGFLAFYNDDQTWCGIATANHVIAYADEWQLPVNIQTSHSGRFLGAGERVIFRDQATDSAVILFFKGDLQLPQVPIALMPVEQACDIGADVGWLGYPAIEPNRLCFFSGKISASHSGNYLIDGVAINGVSGGPVFHSSEVSGIRVIGCVLAYLPNVSTGVSLPGLARAQNVSHFHQVATQVRNIDDARRRQQEFDEQMRTQQATIAPVPSAGTSPMLSG